MRIELLTFLLFSVSCTIATPLKDRRGSGYSKTMLVAVTNAVLNPGRDRALFYRYSNEILEKLPQAPGNLGGSIRREILGEEAWTLTLWESEEALKKFVLSRDHLDSMYLAESAIKEMRQTTFAVRPDEAVTWELALSRIQAVPYRRLRSSAIVK